MAGGGNKNPVTGNTPPVQTYPFEQWTAPTTGELYVPPAPTVGAVPTIGGVNTGIPQGGYAAPAIEQYMAGTAVPTLSYDPTVSHPWQDLVQQDAAIRAEEFARQSGGLGMGINAVQKADGSHLSQDYYDKQVQTIRDETGWADYDPRVDTFAGSEYEDAYRNSAAAQEAADTLYSNQVGVGAGNSLESGRYSGLKVLDGVQSGLEGIGQFSPLLGIAATGLDNARDTKANEYRADTPRTAMEVAIDRETNARQDYLDNNNVAIDNLTPYTGHTISTGDDNSPVISAGGNKWGSPEHHAEIRANAEARNKELGYDRTPEESAKAAGFDMNDPSTWSAPNDGGGNDSSSGNDSSDSGCVIATYAKSTGVDIGKREAVEWCMTTLHGNFIGETIRKGYQKLGRKKINAGKAVEHFTEFKRYIDYARGERKDLRAALTFYGRSIQFFVVGIMEK